MALWVAHSLGTTRRGIPTPKAPPPPPSFRLIYALASKAINRPGSDSSCFYTATPSGKYNFSSYFVHFMTILAIFLIFDHILHYFCIFSQFLDNFYDFSILQP